MIHFVRRDVLWTVLIIKRMESLIIQKRFLPALSPRLPEGRSPKACRDSLVPKDADGPLHGASSASS